MSTSHARPSFPVRTLMLLALATASPSFAVKILSPLSNMCLTFVTSETVEMQPCLDTAHQNWEFNVEKGYILSLQRYKCLQTTGVIGSQVTADWCREPMISNQKWSYDAAARQFKSVSDNSKCLAIESSSVGAKLIVSSCSTTAEGQKWYPENIANGDRWISDGSVYLVDRGLLRHVHGEAFPAGTDSPGVGLFDSWFRVRAVNATDFPGGFLTGTEVLPTAKLISSGATVYFIDGDKKRHVSASEVMEKYHFDWNKLEKNPTDAEKGLPLGDPIQ